MKIIFKFNSGLAYVRALFCKPYSILPVTGLEMKMIESNKLKLIQE